MHELGQKTQQDLIFTILQPESIIIENPVIISIVVGEAMLGYFLPRSSKVVVVRR